MTVPAAIDVAIASALVERYEMVRRAWCSAEAYGRDRLGLGVLLHRGMEAWMRAEGGDASEMASVDRASPAPGAARLVPASCSTVPPRALHAEVASLLAAMAVGAAKEQIA